MKYFLLIAGLILYKPVVHAQTQTNKATVDYFKKYATGAALDKGAYHIVQLSQNCLFPASLQVVRQLDDGVYIIKHAATQFYAESRSCISRIAIANSLWKLSPPLEQDANKNVGKGRGVQSFTITVINIRSFLASQHFSGKYCRLVSLSAEYGSMVVSCSLSYFWKHVLTDTAVIFADSYAEPAEEVLLSGFDKSSNSINQAGYSLPFADGRGITTGVKERKMDVTDMDLQKRVISSPIAAAETEPHATSIATMIGGAGNSFYTGRGIARRCSFFSSSFFNLFPDSTNLLVQNNVYIQNHSYGTVNQQYYGAEAAAYDLQTRMNKNLLHVFSSGNRGTEAATTGTYSNLAGFANLTGNFKMANLAVFSSSGPLYDGRLAPQVAAFGLNGTSDAAALVSGTATLLHQVFKDSNAQAMPPASLVKAVLYNTTDDVATRGIDYKSGYGAINVYNAVAAMLQKKYDGGMVGQGQAWTKNISIPAQAANLRVTVCWTDTASPVNNNKALVNDLDLELIEPISGIVYRPWVLSIAPNADSLKKMPVRKRDSLNTAEQVSIELPASGQWQVRVTGTSVQTATAQAFNICWGWDTINNFTFTNPLQAEDISLEENPLLAVKWKVALADTNTTGNLFISYNNGAAWQPVAQNIRLVRQQYKWLVKDTSTTAQLLMDCPFGSFYSNNFVISPVTNIVLNFLCPDSIGITWKKHRYASHYQVQALPDDTAYMRPILVTTDTSITLLRSLYNYNLYTVKPILTNGLPAVQSPAIDIRSQGINCFYTTLDALNNVGKIELFLSLSTTISVDSVVFEKLGSNNSVIIGIPGRLRVMAGQLNYIAADNDPTAGTNTYRVRILYKNGRSSFTETVTVLTTGSRYILLYPNLVASGGVLNYQLKNTAANWQLILADASGRVVLNQPLNTIAGTLRISTLQAGVYFYRLTDTQTRITETGKIIITN
jgi:hypothetical protein